MTAGPELPSGTVTFLFTDIEGSTALLKQLGDAYATVLDDHRRLLREAFSARGGREIDTQGDSFFYAFPRAKQAIGAAVEAQRAFAEHVWPGGVEVRVRMGIHSGEPLVGANRYVGIGVNRAARIGNAAHGGQVLASDATRALVEDDLPKDVFLRELGFYRLKDIDRPERISQVTAEGLPSEFPPLRGAEPIKARPVLRRRSMLAAALLGVVAAAVAVPVFSLTGGSGSSARAFAGVAADSVGVFSARSGKPVAQTQVGTGPSWVAVGAGGVWVTNTAGNSVSRIDPRSNAVVQTIPVGSGPEGVAVGDGFVWVANSLSGSVWKIDPGTNGVVQRIAVGTQPTGVAFGLGGIWVTDAVDRTVVRINPGTGRPGAPITLESGAAGVATGAGAVWVTSGSSPGSVARVDPSSSAVVQTVPVGSDPIAVATHSRTVWVANSQDGTVSVIDAASNKPKGLVPVGSGPAGIAASQKAVWVANEFGGTLSRIDPTENKVVQTVETDNRPAGIASSRGTLYVAVRTSGAAHRGGTLTLLSQPRVSYEPKIDPGLVYELTGTQTLLMTSDGLVAFDHKGGSGGTRLVPDLATSLPTPTDGGRTYTFQIRRGIRYSNGRPVRPADFRRPIERSLATRQSPAGQLFYGGIVGANTCTPTHCDLSKGIVANRAANTITFHLTAPDPDFLYKLTQNQAFALPADTPLEVPLRWPPPATGPYMFARYDAKHEIRLVRNPYFREWSAAAQPDGYPDEVIWRFSGNGSDKDKTTQVREVERGRADVAYDGVPNGLLTELQTQYAREVHNYVALSVGYVPLNTSLPPFNDIRVRRALNYALDRNKMVQTNAPALPPSCQVLPPGMFGYQRYCPYTRHPSANGRYTGPDLAKARQLVAATGTQGQTVTIWTYRGATAARRAGYLATALRKLGYKPRFRIVKDLAALFANVGNPKKKVQLAQVGFGADYASPLDFFGVLLSCKEARRPSGINYAHFCDRRIDQEMAKASSLQTLDPQSSAALWRKVDRDVVNQAPWVSLWSFNGIDFVSRRVGNYIYNPQWGALFDQMWVR